MAAFFAALNTLASVFCDEMSQERLQVYWRVFQDAIDLEEWEYAYRQILLTHTDRRVPFPQEIMAFVTERRVFLAAEHRKMNASRPPLQIREDLMCLEELRKLQRGLWPAERDRWATDPIPPYEQEES